jgi:tRNA-Thr(GGU) m(6)t(6)A37 methyltransferase TsaA
MTPDKVTLCEYKPIGIIRSPHHDPEKTPIQSRFAKNCPGRAEILSEYAEGLRDLDGFSHVFLLTHLHQADSPRLTVKPFLDTTLRGLFATRHSARPNPIGLSIVRLERIEGCILHLLDIDLLDGTPLLDIKPYVPRFDKMENARGGWTADIDEETSLQRGRRGFSGRTDGSGGDS